MNKAIMLGSVCEEPTIIPAGASWAVKFTLAISQGQELKTDFIDCVMFRKSDKMPFNLNDQICVEGSLQTNSYEDKKGVKKYKTQVKVDKWYRAGK